MRVSHPKQQPTYGGMKKMPKSSMNVTEPANILKKTVQKFEPQAKVCKTESNRRVAQITKAQSGYS